MAPDRTIGKSELLDSERRCLEVLLHSQAVAGRKVESQIMIYFLHIGEMACVQIAEINLVDIACRCVVIANCIFAIAACNAIKIGPFSSVQMVVARSAAKGILASFTQQQIISRSTLQVITSSAAQQAIVAVVTAQSVVQWSAD